jgi:hypothetical protein
VGACLLLLAYLRKKTIFSSYKIISIALIGVFIFRGLLTFSRGGMIGALAAVAFSYLYLNWKLKVKMRKTFFQLLLVVAGSVLIFMIANQITGGILGNRYQGETEATLRGDRARNLSTITSNRSKIALAEWAIFSDNVFFGIGPGAGYEAREKYIGVRTASHTEFTRLLAEQGIPGLFIGLIFIFYPLLRIKNSKSSEETYYLIAFFSLALITSFHSAMRTILTPLFWALSCARFSFPQYSQVATNAFRRKKKLLPYEANEDIHNSQK